MTATVVGPTRTPESTTAGPPDLQVSQYTIFVGETVAGWVISHGLYGTFDVVDAETYQILLAHRFADHVPRYGAWAETDRADAPGTSDDHAVARLEESLVRQLAGRGYLVADRQADRAKFVEVAAGLHDAQKQNLVFVVMPTYDCNLGCTYCFQDHLRSDPAHADKLRPMTAATAATIVGAMDDIKRRVAWQEDRNSLSVGLFGGEPFSAATRPALEVLVEELCRVRGHALWAITNGTQLDTCAHLLGPGLVETLQITLDGPPSRHDERRFRRADGGGSFEAIADGIDLALARGCRIDIRVNVDVRNIDELTELVQVCADRGWLASEALTLEAAPVHRGGPDATKEVMFSHLDLTHRLRALAGAAGPGLERVRTVDTGLRDLIQTTLESGTMPSRSGEFCAAYTGMYVFDGRLDVYACWERTASPVERIGQVRPDGTYRPNLTVLGSWRDRSVAANEVCSGCSYGLWCGGGCASQALLKTGDLGSHLCEGYSARFKDAAREALDRSARGVRVRASVAQKGCG